MKLDKSPREVGMEVCFDLVTRVLENGPKEQWDTVQKMWKQHEKEVKFPYAFSTLQGYTHELVRAGLLHEIQPKIGQALFSLTETMPQEAQ